MGKVQSQFLLFLKKKYVLIYLKNNNNPNYDYLSQTPYNIIGLEV